MFSSDTRSRFWYGVFDAYRHIFWCYGLRVTPPLVWWVHHDAGLVFCRVWVTLVAMSLLVGVAETRTPASRGVHCCRWLYGMWRFTADRGECWLIAYGSLGWVICYESGFTPYMVSIPANMTTVDQRHILVGMVGQRHALDFNVDSTLYFGWLGRKILMWLDDQIHVGYWRWINIVI